MATTVIHVVPTQLLAQCVKDFYSAGGRAYDLPVVLDTIRTEYDEVLRALYEMDAPSPLVQVERISRATARMWRTVV